MSTLTQKACPVYLIHECFQGKIIIAIRGWTFLLFLGAADCESLCNSLSEKKTLIVTTVVMILRVWVMYNRSRLILGTLLTTFFLEIISLTLTAAIQSDARNLSGM